MLMREADRHRPDLVTVRQKNDFAERHGDFVSVLSSIFRLGPRAEETKAQRGRKAAWNHTSCGKYPRDPGLRLK